MYTRTHTHTQARTHTTKFSGHVVRFFFFFAVFFSPLRHSCFDEKKTIWCTYSLQHWWYTETSTVIAHNRDVTAPMHAHTQRFSVTWQAQSVSGWIEIHSLRSDPTFFFFFSRGPKVCGHGDASSVTWGGLAREIQQHACYYITRRFQRCTYFWKNARQHAQRQNTHAQWMKITMETVSYTETEWTMHMRTPH